MFSRDIRELEHKVLIKKSYRSSNQVDAIRQILDIGTRCQVFEIRLLYLEVLYDDMTSHPDGLLSSGQGAKDLQLLFDILQQRAPRCHGASP